MNIGIFGGGYVGVVYAAMLARAGHGVVCMDKDAARVGQLEAGELPFFEPGLAPMVADAKASGLLTFTGCPQQCVRGSEFLFITVGTPPKKDGSADLSQVLDVARRIGEEMDGRKVVVVKSTVPVGTGDRIEATIREALNKRGVDLPFVVVSNPEFLSEGSAVVDAIHPARIIVGIDDGAESRRVADELRAMYRSCSPSHNSIHNPGQNLGHNSIHNPVHTSVHNDSKMIVMDRRSAEMTKYAANAMLATRISFINEMASIAEAAGASIEDVRRGIGADPRIGGQHLYPGAGYGGSCLPKDVPALMHLAGEHGKGAAIITAVHETNRRQRQWLGEQVLGRLGSGAGLPRGRFLCWLWERALGRLGSGAGLPRGRFLGWLWEQVPGRLGLGFSGHRLSGRRIAVWGLSFKPGTDDMRESPAGYLLDKLRKHGAAVQAYDPKATDAARARYSEWDGLLLCDTKEEALDGADCLVICTNWKEFVQLGARERSKEAAKETTMETVKGPIEEAVEESPPEPIWELAKRMRQPLIIDGRNIYDPALMARHGIEYYAVGRGYRPG